MDCVRDFGDVCIPLNLSVNLLILTVIKGCILTIEWACFHSIVHVNFLLQVVRIRIKMNKKWAVAVAKTLNKSDFVPFVFCL